jgi:hypothetical protein
MNSTIDFKAINAAARTSYRALLPELLPGGKFRGPEYVCTNPRRDDKSPGSFKINFVKNGVWKDFASGEGGSDFISLVSHVKSCSQGDAARRLAERLQVPLHSGSKSSNGAAPPPSPRAPKPIMHGATPKIHQRSDPPHFPNEARRHEYRRDGGAVRVKIKRKDGSFVNWYRVGADQWLPKKPDDYRAVPYCTATMDPFDPELIGDEILWPEGEKDVDNLGKIDQPAFTFGGAGDGLPGGISDYLKDRRLVILADNDDPGREHAEKKAELAHAAGAASIKVVHFPELPPKGDVSDLIEGGMTAEQLLAHIDATTPWTPPRSVSEPEPKYSWRAGLVSAAELQSMSFAPVRYVLPGYITEGLTLIAGKPKIGKSWMTFDLAIAATADRYTLGTLKPTQGDILYLALEDNRRRLKSRMGKLLQSQTAQWPPRLEFATDWKRLDEGGLDDIKAWCDEVANPTAVIIDTLEKIRPIQTGKTNAYSADYAAITGLQKIAGQRHIAIIAVHHLRKMDADDPFDTVSGTLGLTGAADTIIVLRRHAGGVTLHARGRDIEEAETALQFNKSDCKWKILGAAPEVYRSQERGAVLAALETAGAEGLAVPEIMAATRSVGRGAMDTLLFKMKEDGEIMRVKRGVYALSQDRGKIGQKERNGVQIIDHKEKDCNLTDLTDLTDLSGVGE